MTRKTLAVLLLAIPFGLGCAGPTQLAERSEDKLADGELWRAWTLAIRALDKAPGNPRARAAAARASGAIADDWRRRIHALASVDSVMAAAQVIEFASFRAGAARYTTVPLAPTWAREEEALRQGAARIHYQQGITHLESRRPKKAYLHFMDAERFAPGFRDASRLADRALEQALTRVAFVPLRTTSVKHSLGRDVAASWSGDVLEHLSPAGSHFTRILPIEDVERLLTVSDLGRLSRDEAARLGHRAGADRVVWGTIGAIDSQTSFHIFSDLVARRIVEKGSDGQRTTRWVDVPIEVVARVRTVAVDLECEVIATRGGATLSRRRDPRSMSARVVWTSHSPEGNPEAYALVSEPSRAADPERAKRVETRWKAVVGERTSLSHVLEAKRLSRPRSPDRNEVLARFMAGAEFVLLEELPPVEDLAFAALAGGWRSVHQDLVRLDAVDDVDLGLTTAGTDRH